MKHFWQRLVSITTVGAFLASLSVVPAQAETTDFSEYGMGCLGYGSDLTMSQVYQAANSYSTNDFSDVTILDSVDLSQTNYFPSIGHQGQIGSCSAWATTYYQFTYEVNKFNGVTEKVTDPYSPAFTYNLLSSDTDDGISLQAAYMILEKQGALKMSEYSYSSTSATNYSFDWPTDTNAMLSALSVRKTVDNHVPVTVTTSSTNKITHPDDTKLNEIKRLLSAGKCPVVACYSMSGLSNWSVATTTNGEKAVYRAHGSIGDDDVDAGHALTVVGYDDSIQCDFNGNGTIENSEKGAFKLANSWGTSYGNDGYIWVMYDALNYVSANTTNNWESSEEYDRTAIFDFGSSNTNRFYYINVERHEVNLVALCSFTSNYPYDMEIFTNRGTSYSTSTEYRVFRDDTVNYNYGLNSYTGTLAFDYGTLDDDIDNLLSTDKWYLRLYNTNSLNPITNMQYKIADNHGTILNSDRVISRIGASASSTRALTLSLQLGDVNYDGTLSQTDAETIMSYLVRLIELSDLQKELADYDQNGVIQITDVTAMSNAMPASEAQAFKESIYAAYAQSQNAQTYSMNTSDTAYAELVAQLYNYFESQEG